MYAIRDVVLSPSYPGHPDIPISPFSFIITKIPNETPAPSLSDPPKLPHRSRFGSYDHSDPAIPAKPPRHDRFDRFERFERFTAVKPNPRNHAEPAGESEEIVDDWEMPKEDAADFDLSVGSTVSPFRRELSNETTRFPRICSRPRAMRRSPRIMMRAWRRRMRAFRARRSSGNC